MGKHSLGRRAVFLDRDGVLNQPIVHARKPYPPKSLLEFKLYPDVAAGCATLKANGFLLVLATNQPDVGRKTQDRAIVEAFHDRLRAQIPAIDHVEVCYHAGEEYGETCDCRKPKTGMLARAAGRFGIDLTASYLIGDRWRDVDCALAAGCRAIFIDRGYDEDLRGKPHFFVNDFAQAVEALLCDAQPALD